MQDRLIKRREVETLTALPRSTIYEKMSKGAFPRPFRVGECGVRWRLSDIHNWINALPEASAA